MSLDRITLSLRLFEDRTDRKRSRINILYLMECFSKMNKSYLKKHKGTRSEIPSLYKSSVIYSAESSENRKDIYHTLKDGHGDCEDLACWRVAALQLAGIAARPYIRWKRKRNKRGWIYHALVWHPGNKIEDPSLSLGMHGKIIRKPIFINP